MYIYKLGTECDGGKMRASVVYIPTLVALLGLCFDPSECFRDLCVWSRVMGNKSSKLWYVSRIMTLSRLVTHTCIQLHWASHPICLPIHLVCQPTHFSIPSGPGTLPIHPPTPSGLCPPVCWGSMPSSAHLSVCLLVCQPTHPSTPTCLAANYTSVPPSFFQGLEPTHVIMSTHPSIHPPIWDLSPACLLSPLTFMSVKDISHIF